MNDTSSAPGIDKIILAVHGIGDQSRNETALSIVTRFCDHRDYPALVPLGGFFGALQDGAPPFVIAGPPPCPGLVGTMGFAEVYWADIPRRTDQRGYTLQETKAWARALVNRVHTLALLNNGNRDNVDYHQIERVLEEMISGIAVIEALLFIARKAQIIDFNLQRLLDAYLGDVQVMTEFAGLRERILARFDALLDAAHRKCPNAEIYIVAHSEGTVVCWLGLLRAIAAERTPEWLSQVRGFMTIGSPIDKHHILWPALFEALGTPRARPPAAENRIRWRNYVDYGDPVGFELDTARQWMSDHGYTSYFDFTEADDFAFGRYYLPGKAHTDYWNDPMVFGHFIEDVVDRPPGPSPQPRSKPAKPRDILAARVFSYAVAYAIPLLALFAGVYVLYKTLTYYLEPQAPLGELLANVTAIGGLLAGATVFLRIWELVRAAWWRLIGLGIYALSGWLYLSLVRESAEPFKWLGALADHCALDMGRGTKFGVLIGSAVLVLATLIGSARWLIRSVERFIGFSPVLGIVPGAGRHRHRKLAQDRWPGGLTFLLGFGAAALLGTAIVNVIESPGSVPTLSLAAAGAAFLFLWRLAALLFDLVFVWHRYIRHAVGLTFLRRTLAKGELRKDDPAAPAAPAAPAPPKTPETPVPAM